MPLDPSISLGVKPPALSNALTDPAQFNQLIGTANGLQTMGAKQAIGQAYQQATDPTSGQTDYTQANRLIMSNPQAAYGAPEAHTALLEQARAHLANQGITAENWKKQNDVFASKLTPILADKALMSDGKALRGAITDAIGSFASLPSDLQPVKMPQLIQAMQQLNSIGDDAPKLQQWLTRLSLSHQQSEQLQAQIFGRPQFFDTGQEIKPLAVSPITGTRPIGAPMPLSMNPAQAAAPVPGPPDATGAPTNIPAGNFGAAFGVPGSVGGRPNAPQAGGQSPAPAPQGTRAGSAAPPAPAGPVLPKGMPTGLPPGQVTAADRTAAASADEGTALQRLAGAVPEKKAIFNNMLDDLQHITPGKWSESQQQLESLSQKLAGVGITMDAKQLAAAESFHKLASQIALQQSGAANGTDLTTRTAMGANPGPEFSKLGNQQLIGMLKGNEDYISAKNNEWQSWKTVHGAQTFGDFSKDFLKKADPRVFQSQYMSPEQKATMVKGMSDKDKQEFRQKYNEAVRSGWLADPRGAR